MLIKPAVILDGLINGLKVWKNLDGTLVTACWKNTWIKFKFSLLLQKWH